MPSDREMEQELRLPFPEFPSRSCINCGLLADYHGPIGSPIHGETSLWMRRTGRFSPGQPWCFDLAPAIPLQQEAGDRLPPFKADPYGGATVTYMEGVAAANRAVIERDRDCPQWTAWQPGYTPREHHERREVQREQDHREAFDAKLAQDAGNTQRWIAGMTALTVIVAIVAIVTSVLCTNTTVNNNISTPPTATAPQPTR